MDRQDQSRRQEESIAEGLNSMSNYGAASKQNASKGIDQI